MPEAVAASHRPEACPPHEDAEITDHRAQEPDKDGGRPDQVAYGDHHGRPPDAAHGTKFLHEAKVGHGGDAANQSAGGPETGDPQGTKQSAGLLAALVANDNDLGGGLTHGVGHIRLHHEVLTNERCKNQAQHRAANGHQHDLENAELRIIVQDENAGNG